jgi:hypothetical protein
MTKADVQTENQILNASLVKSEQSQAEFIPVEIVRDEERRVVFTPSRWQMAVFAVIGILGFIGVATAGIFLVVIGLLIAIPLMILRGIFAPMFRR